MKYVKLELVWYGESDRQVSKTNVTWEKVVGS